MGNFGVGEYVVYGTSGVCCIDDIRVCRLSPDLPMEEYYILKPVGNPSSRVFVPRINERLCSKMRAVMTKNEIDDVIASLSGCKMNWIDDRKLRTSEFKSILLRGDRRELILLIRCILYHKQELEKTKKKVSSADSDILQAAEKAIRDEFSFALGIDAGKIADYVKNGIDS